MPIIVCVPHTFTVAHDACCSPVGWARCCLVRLPLFYKDVPELAGWEGGEGCPPPFLQQLVEPLAQVGLRELPALLVGEQQCSSRCCGWCEGCMAMQYVRVQGAAECRRQLKRDDKTIPSPGILVVREDCLEGGLCRGGQVCQLWPVCCPFQPVALACGGLWAVRVHAGSPHVVRVDAGADACQAKGWEVAKHEAEHGSIHASPCTGFGHEQGQLWVRVQEDILPQAVGLGLHMVGLEEEEVLGSGEVVGALGGWCSKGCLPGEELHPLVHPVEVCLEGGACGGEPGHHLA